MIGRNTLLALRRRSPTAVWIVAVAYGALMIITSLMTGVGEYHNGAQSVGYLSAINWTVGFTVFTPLFLFFLIRALRGADQMIASLAARGMIVDAAYQPLPDAGSWLRDRWEATLRRLGPIAFFVVAGGFVLMYLGWFRESGGPLLFDIEPERGEIDWSVAYMDSPIRVQVALNAAFSFAAYFQQAVFAAGLLLIAVVAFAFAEFVQGLVTFGNGPRLAPRVTSSDPRLGFQVFSNVAENVLLAVAFAYGQLYLGRVWNVYQRSETASFQDFFIRDLLAGFTAGFDGVIPFFASFGQRQVGSAVEIVILMATALLGVVALTMVLIALRFVARDSRQLLSDYLDSFSPTATYQGMPVPEARKRLKDMSLWPVLQPGPNQLLVIAGMAVAVMFFYRLGFFYLGVLLLYLIKRSRSIAEGDLGGNGGPPPAVPQNEPGAAPAAAGGV